MPVKVTSVQIRPNITVDWYTPEKLGGDFAKHSLGYDDRLLESPTVEISSDGLVNTKTFLFPDGWGFEVKTELDKEYSEAMQKYLYDNNIDLELEIETI